MAFSRPNSLDCLHQKRNQTAEMRSRTLDCRLSRLALENAGSDLEKEWWGPGSPGGRLPSLSSRTPSPPPALSREADRGVTAVGPSPCGLGLGLAKARTWGRGGAEVGFYFLWGRPWATAFPTESLQLLSKNEWAWTMGIFFSYSVLNRRKSKI